MPFLLNYVWWNYCALLLQEFFVINIYEVCRCVFEFKQDHLSQSLLRENLKVFCSHNLWGYYVLKSVYSSHSLLGFHVKINNSARSSTQNNLSIRISLNCHNLILLNNSVDYVNCIQIINDYSCEIDLSLNHKARTDNHENTQWTIKLYTLIKIKLLLNKWVTPKL